MPDIRLPQTLRDSTSFVLVRLSAMLRQHCADQLPPIGLTQHKHAILSCLQEFGPAAQKDVAARLGLDAGDLVSLLDDLQRDGLIVRERDPRDRRRQIITITEPGLEVLERAAKLLDDAISDALQPLTPDEQRELRTLAVRVLQAHAPQNWVG